MFGNYVISTFEIILYFGLFKCRKLFFSFLFLNPYMKRRLFKIIHEYKLLSRYIGRYSSELGILRTISWVSFESFRSVFCFAVYIFFLLSVFQIKNYQFISS
uniref:Uncharacterized protein n=1 Tax=Cacopsylla melanoneura TaxID=428564 RepID=A0A8D8WR64_9HEMI